MGLCWSAKGEPCWVWPRLWTYYIWMKYLKWTETQDSRFWQLTLFVHNRWHIDTILRPSICYPIGVVHMDPVNGIDICSVEDSNLFAAAKMLKKLWLLPCHLGGLMKSCPSNMRESQRLWSTLLIRGVFSEASAWSQLGAEHGHFLLGWCPRRLVCDVWAINNVPLSSGVPQSLTRWCFFVQRVWGHLKAKRDQGASAQPDQIGARIENSWL